MAVKPAPLYAEQLKNKFIETWYDDKYKYYYCDSYRNTETVNESNWNENQFVSVKNDQIIGYIGYSIDRDTLNTNNLQIINFSDDKLTFGKDLYEVLTNIFLKFNYRKLGFSVVIGNPIEKSYDRWVKKFNGKIVGVKKEEARLENGKYYDVKLYEVYKDNVLSVLSNKK